MSAQTGVGPPGQARQHPQVDQDLEAVADADDQTAGLDEFLQCRAQGQLQPQGQDDTGAVIVAPGKSPGHGQEVVVPEDCGILQQIGGVDPHRLGPGPRKGISGLEVAVEAVAVEHQSLRLWGRVLGFGFWVLGFHKIMGHG